MLGRRPDVCECRIDDGINAHDGRDASICELREFQYVEFVCGTGARCIGATTLAATHRSLTLCDARSCLPEAAHWDRSRRCLRWLPDCVRQSRNGGLPGSEPMMVRSVNWSRILGWDSSRSRPRGSHGTSQKNCL